MIIVLLYITIAGVIMGLRALRLHYTKNLLKQRIEKMNSNKYLNMKDTINSNECSICLMEY